MCLAAWEELSLSAKARSVFSKHGSRHIENVYNASMPLGRGGVHLVGDVCDCSW